MSASAMFRVTFEPSGRTASVPAGSSILEAAASAGIRLRAPCGGNGTCGKCLVRLRSGETAEPASVTPAIDPARFADGWRQACRSHLASDAVVEIPEGSLEASAQQILVSDAGSPQSAPPSDPFIEVLDIDAPAPSREDDRPDALRVSAAAGRPLRFPRAVLASLPAVARRCASTDPNGRWRLRVACAGDSVAAVLPAGSRVLGVAFDLGTTTVVGTLIDLESGAELGVASALNGQIPFGDDVLARILRVRDNQSGLSELRDAAVATLNSIFAKLLTEPGQSSQVAYVALAGNTTMQQLLCGIDPSALGELPFAPAFAEALDCSAGELGLAVNPAARVFVFPQVGGFVGGDTVACMLASDYDRLGKPTLLVDIGTNGEIALLLPDGSILCASTAAGPAFEGARISQGMRATAGAIDKAEIRDGRLEIDVIGGVAPAGLCGTALIDIVAELLRSGVIDETGRILDASELDASVPDDLRARVAGEEGDARFILAFGGADGAGEVALRQRDIRELQLASGALRAGVDTLLARAGLSADDLDAVLLAGAFGNYIRRENAIRIGLLPPVDVGRVRFVGNAASLGAKKALRSRGDRARAALLGSRARHVDLSSDPEFQMNFSMAMLFPDS